MHFSPPKKTTLDADGTCTEECNEGCIYTFAPYGEMLATKTVSTQAVEERMLRDKAINARIAVTEAGIHALLPHISLQQLRHPDVLRGTEIGHGIEASVQKIVIHNRAFVVKLFDEPHFTRVQSKAFDVMRMHMAVPNYVKQLRFTEMLVQFLKSVPIPLAHICLHSLTEYAASRTFHVMAEGPSFSLEDIQTVLQGKSTAKADVAHFVQEHCIIADDVRRLQREIDSLEGVCALSIWSEIPPFHTKQAVDFSPGNFLVKSFDANTRLFEIAIVDQGRSLPFEDWPDYACRTTSTLAIYEEQERDEHMRLWMAQMGIRRPTLEITA